MIDRENLTGKELGQQLWQLIRRFPDQFTGDDERLVAETEERLKDHDSFLEEILPNLRNRVTALEQQVKDNA